MKTVFESPRRLGLALACLAGCISAFAMTTRTPEPAAAPAHFGLQHAAAQRALADKPVEEPAPSF